MGGATGYLPGPGRFLSRGFRNAGAGRFSSRPVYIRMFLTWTFSPGTICKLNIVRAKRDGVFK